MNAHTAIPHILGFYYWKSAPFPSSSYRFLKRAIIPVCIMQQSPSSISFHKVIISLFILQVTISQRTKACNLLYFFCKCPKKALFSLFAHFLQSCQVKELEMLSSFNVSHWTLLWAFPTKNPFLLHASAHFLERISKALIFTMNKTHS